MKKILLITNYFIVKSMVEHSLANAADYNISVVAGIDAAIRALRKQRFSAIILTELVSGKKNWQDLISSTEEVEHAHMIVFRVGLDESSEPFTVETKVFASVHGRTKQGDQNSLMSKLTELLAK